MVSSKLDAHSSVAPRPFRAQLLKWVGNKQTQAESIIGYFPKTYATYYEPFLGSGGVLGVLSPPRALASDGFAPLMEIWHGLADDPESLKTQYRDRFGLMTALGKEAAYARVLRDFNETPNGADLVFLCRACYGGVVRFRKHDGRMSTPLGVHRPMAPERFAARVDSWHARTSHTRFEHLDFADAMQRAGDGDVVYCDPPYADSQTILYGAQAFSLRRLFDAIQACKSRGARVLLSIDGSKMSGRRLCDVPIPDSLFEREVLMPVGRSMLKRFQMAGRTLEQHEVEDRLLLTY